MTVEAFRRGGPPAPRLLAVGFAVPATGLTRVTRAILEPLAADYDVDCIGIGYKDPVRRGPVTLHPCNLEGGDVFGVYQARDFVERHRPAAVLLVNDLWIVAKYLRHLAPFRPTTTLVAYAPLDGELADDDLVEALEPLDRLVVYTKLALREVGRSVRRLERGRAQGGARTSDRAEGDEVDGHASSPDGHGLGAPAREAFHPPALDAIPHGVDTDLFRPLAGGIDAQLADGGRDAARRRAFPDDPDWHDAFVVLNANRAQPRKRIDLTLEGFARFAAGKPLDVKLRLHHAILSRDEHEALVGLAGRLGIRHRVRITPPDAEPLSDEELNVLYNACDVGVNTSMGEGWGLVSFEHAATGAAQVVPRHSACEELWDGAAELVDARDVGVPDHSLLRMREVSADGVAAALERLYTDPAHRRERARAAYGKACAPEYRWANIAERWRVLLAGTRADSASATADAVV